MGRRLAPVPAALRLGVPPASHGPPLASSAGKCGTPPRRRCSWCGGPVRPASATACRSIRPRSPSARSTRAARLPGRRAPPRPDAPSWRRARSAACRWAHLGNASSRKQPVEVLGHLVRFQGPWEGPRTGRGQRSLGPADALAGVPFFRGPGEAAAVQVVKAVGHPAAFDAQPVWFTRHKGFV